MLIFFNSSFSILNMLDIHYKNKKVEDYCKNPKLVQKDFNIQLAKKISQRMDELQSFNSIYQLLSCGIDNPHLLIGDLDGCIGWDLTGRIRLILKTGEKFECDFMEQCKTMTEIQVEGVRDYHDGNKKWLIN